jgi:tetratricopeptide (TPR) repeat protein
LSTSSYPAFDLSVAELNSADGTPPPHPACSTRGSTRPTASQLSHIRARCDAGLYLQAYALCDELPPLRSWRGAEARVLAGRLASELGDPRLGFALFALAYREDRRHAKARFFYGGVVGRRWGPLAEWRFMQAQPELCEHSPEDRADWLGSGADVLAQLRDFDRAGRLMEQALFLQPENPWTACQHSDLLSQQDQRPAALAAAERALELQPWYRPAVLRASHLLQQLGHPSQAIELLRSASLQLESSPVLRLLVAALVEEDNPASAALFARLGYKSDVPVRYFRKLDRPDV